MTTLKQIDKKIATFSTNRKKLQILGHEIAMLILNHAAPKGAGPDAGGSGDCTRALKLMREMPKSWQAQMDNWFRQFSPIRVVVKNDKCEYDPKYKGTKEAPVSAEEKLTWRKLEQAAQTPFYELEEPDVESKALDFAALVKLVEGLSKRIESRVEKGEVKPEDVPSAKRIVEQLSGLNITRVKPEPVNDEAGATGGAELAAANG